jgi:serine/threonine-protein kinase
MRTQTPATESDARAIGNFVEWPHGETPSAWRIGAWLGRGGTAEVWHARAPDGREAALKLASPALRSHPAADVLLRREHGVLRAVASPHIVEPYELLDLAGTAVLVLEYLPNGDLVPLLGGRPQQWLPAVRRVLAALTDLHRHGFGHGDVKAANVLFARDGTARLADLTAARPIDSPAAAATAAYGLPAGRRALLRDADCFAFAVLLFQLTTGRLPYGPEGPSDLAALPAVPLADVDPSAASLLGATAAALRAGGRVRGLSYFIDVLESVRPMDA